MYPNLDSGLAAAMADALDGLSAAMFLVDAVGFNQVRGQPLRAGDLADAMEALL